MTRRNTLFAIAMVAVFAACSSGPETPRGSGSSGPAASVSPSGTGTAGGTTSTGGPSAGSTRTPGTDPSKKGKESGQSITGIEGSVLVHPDCYPQCDVPSYTLRDGTITARNTQSRVVATARTNSSGAYRIVIGPGRYTLSVSGGNAPTWNGAPVQDCRSKTVTVVAGQLADGTLECRYATQSQSPS